MSITRTAHQAEFMEPGRAEIRRFIRPLALDESASRVLTRHQKLAGMVLILLPAMAIALWTRPALIGLLALVNLLYLMVTVYKLRTASLGFRVARSSSTTPVAPPADADLPVYTILVPLHREAAVLPHLVRAISDLDYPADKLDVKLLLEQDDEETIEAARSLRLPAFFDLVIVPPGRPVGKPRACNYGLARARGEYVTIFDAEDRPDPDQLRRVIAAFRGAGPEIACAQCKLNFYNPEQNLLTRWFTSEYSMWFDLSLPGLVRRKAPIPLGGTSNHFPTALLAELGGWDAWNVTEDADLGLRLYRRGYATTVVDSTTWEEANSQLGNWIRQRSRWIKGYAQTWLVQMRHPLDLLRALGLRGFLSFHAIIGGGVLLPMLNPFFWFLTIAWYVTRASVIESLFPTWLFLLCAVNFFFGNFAFIYTNVLGTLNRRYFRLIKFVLLLPVYWAMMSVAAWKGVLQLINRASYWEKTVHGLWSPDVPALPDSRPATPSIQPVSAGGRR